MTVKELKEILKNYDDGNTVELVAWSDGGWGCAELRIDGDFVMEDED